MVALNQRNRERCYWHLGYGTRQNIDVGDIARMEASMDTIPSDYMREKIIELLDILDETEKNLRLVSNDGFTVKEIFSGDINRASIRTDSREQQKVWWQEYMRLADQLASVLAAPNYNDTSMDRYKHDHRSMGAYLKAIPGVADTSIASRVQQKRQLSTGFGYEFGYLY